jgi:eukaryotic-like serine/threonine-protein kinase
MTAAWAFVPGESDGETGGGNDTTDRIGPYTVLDGLAEGGMGRVFRAVNPRTGGRLAIKVPRSSAAIEVAALFREISALRCLRRPGHPGHPGIVQMLDHGVTADGPWVALELVRGRTLYDEIETLWRRAPASRPAAAGRLDHALAIGAELAAILAHVHEQGLVHRDLKPANVLLEDGGPAAFGPGPRRRVRLLDFGLACRVRSLGPARDGDRLCIGTMHYAAPEQIAGEPIDGRTDLYSLGCVLYELIAGRRPFDGSSHEVAQRQLYFHPMSPSSLVTALPWAVEDLLLALMAKSPDDRPASAKVVARRLSGLVGARRRGQMCTTSPRAAAVASYITSERVGWGCTAARTSCAVASEVIASDISAMRSVTP